MLPAPVTRIYKPGRAHLQLTTENAGPEFRFIGNRLDGSGADLYPGAGEMPKVIINGINVPWDDFVRDYEVFSKSSGDFFWKGVTIISVDMHVEGSSGLQDSHVNGPLKVKLNWEHNGAKDEIDIKTSYGKIM